MAFGAQTYFTCVKEHGDSNDNSGSTGAQKDERDELRGKEQRPNPGSFIGNEYCGGVTKVSSVECVNHLRSFRIIITFNIYIAGIIQ